MVIVGVKVKENKYSEMEGVITFCCLVDEGTRSDALFFCVRRTRRADRNNWSWSYFFLYQHYCGIVLCLGVLWHLYILLDIPGPGSKQRLVVSCLASFVKKVSISYRDIVVYTAATLAQESKHMALRARHV
jgi:succinate dehydrogenase hydrophobic anchor subunit